VIALLGVLAGENAAEGCEEAPEPTLGLGSAASCTPGPTFSSSATLLELELLTSTVRCRGDTMCRLAGRSSTEIARFIPGGTEVFLSLPSGKNALLCAILGEPASTAGDIAGGAIGGGGGGVRLDAVLLLTGADDSNMKLLPGLIRSRLSRGVMGSEELLENISPSSRLTTVGVARPELPLLWFVWEALDRAECTAVTVISSSSMLSAIPALPSL
jgi:hypothetical protein